MTLPKILLTIVKESGIAHGGKPTLKDGREMKFSSCLLEAFDLQLVDFGACEAICIDCTAQGGLVSQLLGFKEHVIYTLLINAVICTLDFCMHIPITIAVHQKGVEITITHLMAVLDYSH